VKKIKNIETDENSGHYCIFFKDDNTVQTIRTRVENASDTPLTDVEELVISLCDEIQRLEKSIDSCVDEMESVERSLSSVEDGWEDSEYVGECLEHAADLRLAINKISS